MSIKTKAILIALFAVIPGVLLSVLGFQAVSKQKHALSQIIIQSYRNTAKSIIDRIERRVMYRSMRIADEAQDNGFDDNVSEKLRRYAEAEEFVDIFFYMDGEGKLLFPQEVPKPERNLAEIEPLHLDRSFYAAQESEFVKGDIAEAVRLYENSLRENLTDVQRAAVANAAARCYFRLAKYDDAIAKYKLLLDMDYMTLMARFQIGLCSKLQGKSIEAAEALLSLYEGLIKRQWRVDPEENAYFKSRTRDLISELLSDSRNPSSFAISRSPMANASRSRQPSPELAKDVSLHTWEERFDSLGKLEDMLARELDFLAVLKSSIIPDLRSTLGWESGGSSPVQTRDSALKRLSKNIDGEVYLIHAYSVRDGGVLGFRVSLPYIKDWVVEDAIRGSEQDVSIISDDGEMIYSALQTVGRRPEYLVEERFSEFRDWQVVVPRSRIAAVERQATRQIYIYMGLIVLAIATLITGTFLIIRNVSRELEIAQMRSDFVSNVSHELKTPLSLIRLYGETLEMDRIKNEGKRREYYKIITKESERLTHLIDNVLSFSRLEAGKESYQFEHADIGEVVRGTVDTYRFHIERAGFHLEVDIAEELPEIRIDSDAISQALLNLLNNAVKYSAERKHITVRTVMRGDEIAIEVSDEGIGIRKEEQEKIFDKFYRSSTVRQSGGSGLGLTLVKHIIEAHNGRIEMESVEGRGSKFSLIIPAGELEDEKENSGS